MPHQPLSLADTRKVAHLSRLALTDEQLEAHRHHLAVILGHIQQLQQLDLTNVEPMTTPIQSTNRLAEDVPGPMLTNDQLMAIAPQGATQPPFLKVPKVIGGADGT